MTPRDFAKLYAGFNVPIVELDCGCKCAPYNERGIPFCCDTRHAVSTAYRVEWAYLQVITDLWHIWEGEGSEEVAGLCTEIPAGQLLIACLGHNHCQREFRSVTCRAFPFFPYFNSKNDFIGMSYYWEYEDRCWVISNLHVVSEQYRQAFMETFETLFARLPEEIENFCYHSACLRRGFRRHKRAILLLHRNGRMYKVSPHNERMRCVRFEALPKFGPYKIAAKFPFPDEMK